MAFRFFKWLLRSRDAPETSTMEEMFDLFTDCYIRELAFHSCVNLTANAVSKCEVKTFFGGREVRDREYYLWNVSPNQNQSAAAFWHKLVYLLYRDRAALVVENGGKLYIADSWSRQEYALYDDVFSQVTVGDFTFGRTFAASDVLFFELSAQDAQKVVDGLYASYAKLIAYGMKGYQRSRGEKGVLELDANVSGDAQFQETFEKIKNTGFRRFAEAESAVLPMWKGMKYTSLASRTYNADTTRDIRAMIDDVTDFTARAYCIPPPLLNGSVQNVDSATDQFLSFCIDPLVCSTIETEINRKRNGLEGLRQGNYVRIDTSRIKHIDLLDAAGSIDKLLSSGVECVNDIRALLGQTLINEPWAWQHFMTKNYAAVAEVLAAMGEDHSREKQE